MLKKQHILLNKKKFGAEWRRFTGTNSHPAVATTRTLKNSANLSKGAQGAADRCIRTCTDSSFLYLTNRNA